MYSIILTNRKISSEGFQPTWSR